MKSIHCHVCTFIDNYSLFSEQFSDRKMIDHPSSPIAIIHFSSNLITIAIPDPKKNHDRRLYDHRSQIHCPRCFSRLVLNVVNVDLLGKKLQNLIQALIGLGFWLSSLSLVKQLDRRDTLWTMKWALSLLNWMKYGRWSHNETNWLSFMQVTKRLF